MKSKKQDIISELFRKNLEYATVLPDPALKAKLMRKVARQEFMNFNPGSFNIFYLGGILGAVLIASILFFSGNDKTENPKTSADFFTAAGTDTASLNDNAPRPVKLSISSFQNKSIVKSTSTEPAAEINEAAASKPVVNAVSAPENINVPFAKNDIFGNRDQGGKKLKSRSATAENAIFPASISGCAPLRIQFRNNTDAYDSCMWTFGDGGFSDKKEPEWIYDVDGEYKVVLMIFTGGSMIAYTSAVNVYPHPKAHFEFLHENAIIPAEGVRFRNYSVGAERFIWDFGDGSGSDLFEPDHAYEKTGNYDVSLVVVSALGCSDTLTISNAFSASEYFVDFPNAFIPNEQGPSGGYFSSTTDQAAQVFHPSSSGVSEYHLKIFSKLGILIFESYDINTGWDGYNKGQLCDPGVYIWKVRGKFRNGEPFIRMGDVTLLKM